ncbi:hypothetical protein ACFP56_09615 [Paenibacillus septentrionalis]|uniref:ABC transporter permease n=1 Tax=Paenibacillus septentrionalis TaxID=429342 RepID=A0ABW1V270_9BACL
MNQIKGGLYTMYLSCKRDFYIFTAINSFFLILTLVMGALIPDIKIFTIGVIVVVIFTFIIAMKLLDRSLAILLRYGLNRSRYLAVAGAFMLLWSLAHAAVLLILNSIMMAITKQFEITSVIIPRLTMLYDDSLSLLVNYMMDTAFIFMIAMVGMLINAVFYRFGSIGGYSFSGLLLAIIFIGFPLNWFSSLLDVILSWNAALFISVIVGTAALVLTAIWLLTRRISTISANI